ncbi:DUF4199 domain-containing protein [Flavobacterium amniphilum]|uniref:DUF4199 domain-containing protein n=1 Tax=Flavobacterium amniphilum TaxID=1834035 RepID=UPI002029F644|nr:DUF4199 domain-containing protein [Flavobacterium amniphilum]MCL9806665.1 DUF4199 domain-containing protein [Flavobacterium amniphilum]
MNQSKNLPLKMGSLFGALLGTVVVSIGIIRYKTGMILRDDQTLSYVYWCIFTLTVLYAVFQFKKKDPSSFSYKHTVKIGLLAGLISGLLYTVYIVVLNGYIDPELASKIIEYKNANHSGMAAQDVSDSTKIMEMSEALRGLIYTFVCMTFGVIHSMIGTLAAKKIN